jgi:hypothetical protein
MGKFVDLTGMTFGRLRVLGRTANNANGKISWDCICECGNKKIGSSQYLKNGMTDSCGCRVTEWRKASMTTHGQKHSITYRSWSAMKTRCTNPNIPGFKDYGGRGIKFCDRWSSFENFLADMGARPSKAYSLDRKDVDGDYEPDNCRWATRLVQNNNTRANVLLEHDGQRLTLADWSRVTGIDMKTLSNRVKKGWSAEETLTHKPRYGFKRVPLPRSETGQFASPTIGK